jgi:hypothetical protein
VGTLYVNNSDKPSVSIYGLRPQLNIFTENKAAYGLFGAGAKRLSGLLAIDEGNSRMVSPSVTPTQRPQKGSRSRSRA